MQWEIDSDEEALLALTQATNWLVAAANQLREEKLRKQLPALEDLGLKERIYNAIVRSNIHDTETLLEIDRCNCLTGIWGLSNESCREVQEALVRVKKERDEQSDQG